MNYSLLKYVDELGKTLGDELLTPTKIYVEEVYPLIEKYDIHGIAHITGGGIYENLPRILPEGLGVDIDMTKALVPKIFDLLAEWGEISREEMYNTFNMGVGMVLIVDPEEGQRILEEYKEKEIEIYKLGHVREGDLCIKI